jgi:hypothetical protein
VESGLPTLHRLAGSLWCKSKVYYLLGLHLSDDAEDNVAALLAVYRNAADLAEDPSERTPEELGFDHAVDVSAY